MGAAVLIRWLAHAITRTFYVVDRAGHVPSAGAALLLPNHANALLDPAIVWATAGRDIRFLAKSTLFDGPFAPVLRAAGAIPVYRRIDQGVDHARNAETFAAVERALAAGDAICLFPEGISHSTGRLEPLRTGAARMAIGAERQGVAVQLVAVGLNFDRKTAFRSHVTVVFGRPFSAKDVAGDDDPAAVKTLTERIAGEMRRILVEVDADADEALVRRIERLYAAARGRPRDPAERVARRRTITAGIEGLRDAEPARFQDITLRLRRYDQRLRRFRLRDAHLDWDVSIRAAVAFVLREGLAALVLVPVAAVALALFWIPYQLTGLLARRATDQRDVAATAKVFVGLALYGVWLVFIAVLVARVFGASGGAIVAAALPIGAVAGLYAIEREAAVLEMARAWLVLRRARQPSRAWLRRTRSDLAEVLDEVYGWLSAAPREPPAGQKPR